MTQFLGEFYCKADQKGRVLFPSGLRKQLPQEARDTLVVNRGFEQCLVLYPQNEWEKIAAEIEKLSYYNQKNRAFKRYFFRGATELTFDNSSRILLPKKLMEYAGIEKELVFFAHTNKIEVWSKEQYEALISDEPEDFADLAEQVMGNKPDDNNDDDNK